MVLVASVDADGPVVLLADGLGFMLPRANHDFQGTQAYKGACSLVLPVQPLKQRVVPPVKINNGLLQLGMVLKAALKKRG